MLTLKVTTIGSAQGVILSGEAMALLGVKTGDVLQLAKTAEGSVRILPKRSGSPDTPEAGGDSELWREFVGLACGLGRAKL